MEAGRSGQVMSERRGEGSLTDEAIAERVRGFDRCRRIRHAVLCSSIVGVLGATGVRCCMWLERGNDGSNIAGSISIVQGRRKRGPSVHQKPPQ